MKRAESSQAKTFCFLGWGNTKYTLNIPYPVIHYDVRDSRPVAEYTIGKTASSSIDLKKHIINLCSFSLTYGS